ncbi:pimeloyl-ACP methyl ester carboxylesterase [Ulvibacter sp. MAR_2010_11]|uniref:alpha/beta fold hydrolase n=1 Tax=Ulvibacter sp. MAR_2010_11 TaxID=1250229 RepID=UPI000C2CB581|nr:alpha/beta hydrolase [Ulvibacter sp. MAR_2010_11]PKA84481.1 pimeloyl-ACP methyl ester carboxylesterase [Ulvibacter sp. MAR_2010_11]
MKETLLLLHGALGSKDQFNASKKRLEETYNVHAINFEGHGGTAYGSEFSIRLFTDNVIDHIKANSINEVTIFGYSMGGYVALNVALKLPEKVKKIYTLGTKFKWDRESAEIEVKMLNPNKIEEKIPLFAENLKQVHYPQDWKVVMNMTADMMLNMAKGAKLVDDDLKKINQKVIIGIGSLDTMVSYEESAYASNILPNSKLIQLDGVKHPIDQIETDELINFIMSN